MKKFRLLSIFLLIVLLTSCGPSQAQIEQAIAETKAAMPTETATPHPTNTPEPTEINQYGKFTEFVEKFNFYYMELVKDNEDAEGIKNIDLYFEGAEGGTVLRSNLGVSIAQRNTVMPFALSFAVVKHIVASGSVSYPEDMNAYVITLYDDVSGTKVKTYELKWFDFMEYVNEKITFEQVYTRMEKSN